MSSRRRGGPGMWVGAGLALASIVAACSTSTPTRFTPPLSGGSGAMGAGGSGGGSLFQGGNGGGGPPAADAGGYCGNNVHQVILDAPNVYFVFDISGSMSTPVGTSTRYGTVRAAAIGLVARLGALINVGAAAFPVDATEKDPCHPGREIFPVQQGTPGMAGATTAAFIAQTEAQPNGGTPTAATLTALLPGLRELRGRTIVILSTDGGPNCNPSATCGADECSINLDGDCVANACCGQNCCAPSGGLSATLECVDLEGTVAAVAAIEAAGIQVFVVGIPGSEAYANVLDQMALAGGAPQIVPPYYYRIGDLGTLDQTFASIASLVVSCDFTLTDPPAMRGDTNVYLDRTVLPYDPENGWTWKSDSVVELEGQACAELKAGQVEDVQIVSGCPTQVPK